MTDCVPQGFHVVSLNKKLRMRLDFLSGIIKSTKVEKLNPI